MSEAANERPTGAEDVVWDLSVFYQGLDDPQMEADIANLTEKVDAFQARYRGKVADMSAADFVSAYEALEAIYDLRGRLGSFAFPQLLDRYWQMRRLSGGGRAQLKSWNRH